MSIYDRSIISKVSPFFLFLCFFLTFLIIMGCQNQTNISDSEAYSNAFSYIQAKEYDSAFTILSDLAQRGDPNAQAQLGLLYAYGRGINKDFEKAVYWLKLSADQGIPTSMGALGDIYLNGVGGKRNCVEGLYWYNRAAEADDTLTLYALSQMYMSGVCVDVDKSTAEEYIYKASLGSDDFARLCKGLVSFQGINGPVDYVAAKAEFEKLYVQGNGRAAYYLYIIYSGGLGVERDVEKSVVFLKKASNLGDSTADCALAVAYFKGDNVAKDYEKSHFFAMKSKDTVSESAYILGVLYEQGFGVAVDIDAAKKWYQQAIDMGCQKAHKRFSSLP